MPTLTPTISAGVLDHRDLRLANEFATNVIQLRIPERLPIGRVTLMVNDMLQDDTERAGRIRDNGALLAEGADARMKAIEAEALAQHRRKAIEAALPHVQSTLDGVQGNYRRNSLEMTQVMIEFQESLTKAFFTLGLTEGQEEMMTQLAGDYMQRLVVSQDASLTTIGQLESLARSLEALLKRQ